MSKVICADCDIEYEVRSKEAEEDDILPTFCPFCGFETKDDLDFNDDDYPDDDYDWDEYDE